MNKNIRLRVKNLIKKYNTSDPTVLCEKLGIIVLHVDLGDLKGYYKHPRGRKIIVINVKMYWDVKSRQLKYWINRGLTSILFRG